MHYRLPWSLMWSLFLQFFAFFFILRNFYFPLKASTDAGLRAIFTEIKLKKFQKNTHSEEVGGVPSPWPRRHFPWQKKATQYWVAMNNTLVIKWDVIRKRLNVSTNTNNGMFTFKVLRLTTDLTNIEFF